MNPQSDAEFAEAGYLLGDLLAQSLFPSGSTWTDCRAPYIWEHNALCWLVRNRDRVPTLNLWLATVLDEGYPFKPFTHFARPGETLPAGAWWNKDMTPKGRD